MIQEVGFLYWLKEDNYKNICRKLGLNETAQKIKDNCISIDEKGFSMLFLYNVEYTGHGRVWYMETRIDFPKYNCSHTDFPRKLYENYTDIFDTDIMNDFPSYDLMSCNHMKYYNVFDVSSADEVITRLSEKHPPEQLDKSLWSKHKGAGATIDFCFSKKDATHIETLARCNGSALKRRVDNTFHRVVGVDPYIAINPETENQIVSQIWNRHTNALGI